MLTPEQFKQIETSLEAHTQHLAYDKKDEPINDGLVVMLDDSSMIKSLNHIELISSWPVLDCRGETHLIIARVNNFITGRGISMTEEIQVFGLKRLKSSYKHFVIRRETFQDKLAELIRKTEIDIKGFPKFSKKYFFQASDKESAMQFFTPERILELEKVEHLELEVINHNMLMRFQQPLSSNNCAAMIHLLQIL